MAPVGCLDLVWNLHWSRACGKRFTNGLQARVEGRHAAIRSGFKVMVKDLVLRQLARATFSVAANLEESLAAYSRADFAAKVAISAKEGREMNFWLRLGKEAGVLTAEECERSERASMPEGAARDSVGRGNRLARRCAGASVRELEESRGAVQADFAPSGACRKEARAPYWMRLGLEAECSIRRVAMLGPRVPDDVAAQYPRSTRRVASLSRRCGRAVVAT